jgi:hypothetical protein
VLVCSLGFGRIARDRSASPLPQIVIEHGLEIAPANTADAYIL